LLEPDRGAKLLDVAFEELAVRLGLALHQVGEAGRDGIDLVSGTRSPPTPPER
jgi:hypothetical protein